MPNSFFRESWSRRRYVITQVIVTSCYIANINFTTLMRVKQVKTLKGALGIVSDEGICMRPNDGREMDSGGRFNNIDNQTVFFQLITMLVT
ncbi:hypothetical protein AE42_02138 [Enterobacter kobei]|nr:hypothetical protein AE42_02138 [Enterobacter kobei]